MNEKEAKTKWCPMVRESGPDNRTIWNRAGEDQHDRCLGSGCMAWRKAPQIVLTGHGYCGLAGKP